MVYCQWQCTLLQTLTMTQPPGSHRPLHGLHLTANKVPHTRSCVGIGHSQRECSPLHHGEVPTHAGAGGADKAGKIFIMYCFHSCWHGCFYSTTHSTHFILRIYGVGHMVKDHSDCERGYPLTPHGLLFPINRKVSFICTIPQPLLHQSWSTGWNDK